jgi:hypothetical protein
MKGHCVICPCKCTVRPWTSFYVQLLWRQYGPDVFVYGSSRADIINPSKSHLQSQNETGEMGNSFLRVFSTGPAVEVLLLPNLSLSVIYEPQRCSPDQELSALSHNSIVPIEAPLALPISRASSVLYTLTN